MGFFLVKSPLALAIGEALIEAGSVVELPDDAQAAHLVSNGTLEPAEIDPSQAEAYAQAKADAGIAPDEVMVATPDDLVPSSELPSDGAPASDASTTDLDPAPESVSAPAPTKSGKRKA